MWDQEVHHHNTFNRLQVDHRVRPSLLTPAWKAGAFAMGLFTGLLGKEGAMACTEAVETVIGNHYNQQLRVLSNGFNDIEEINSDKVSDSADIKYMKDTIKVFRDEELEHLDTAIEHDSKKARPYWLLTETIKVTCKAAVWTAERF